MNHTNPRPAEIDRLYERLNDSSIDRVMAIDMQWKIIAWNRTSELASGLFKQDVIGKHLLEMFPQMNSDPEMIRAIENAFAGVKSFLPAKNGFFNRQYVENHFIPLRKDNGKVMGVMNIMHDVAHRIKAEKQLERLNAALEKNYVQLEKATNDLATFTYITGRDVKDPIRDIYSSIEMLVRKEGHLLSNINRGNLRKIQGSLNKMSLLLDDILAVSRISTYNKSFDHVDLNQVAAQVMKKMSEKVMEKNAAIHFEALPVIKGSEELLVYLFEQIIGNSLKFQPAGNDPVVEVRCTITLKNETDYFEISFKDNGIGFDNSEGERIFEAFVKLNHGYKGSGIGLTMCKKIMDLHDGSITAEGRHEEGAIIRCYFPLNLAAQA